MTDVLALQSMFEGLYVRGLKPTGAFKEKLRAKGFDLDRQQASYPLKVWTDCLDVSSAELYPGLVREQAWEQLGRRFIEGYFDTLVGAVIRTALPFLTPKLFVNRAPRFISTGMQHAQVSLTWDDERRARLVLLGVHEFSSALMMGVMAVCFERIGKGTVKLSRVPLGPVDTSVLIQLP